MVDGGWGRRPAVGFELSDQSASTYPASHEGACVKLLHSESRRI